MIFIMRALYTIHHPNSEIFKDIDSEINMIFKFLIISIIIDFYYHNGRPVIFPSRQVSLSTSTDFKLFFRIIVLPKSRLNKYHSPSSIFSNS